MPITEALKKLIKTITGKNAVGETIEELVTNLNDNYPEGGGGGDTYETVAEIEVGTMTQGDEGVPEGWWLYASQQEQFSVDDGDIFYLNDAEHPSDDVEIMAGITSLVMFNCEMVDGGGIRRLDETTPAYIISLDNDNNESNIGIGVLSTSNISDSTIKILKKVSGGGGSSITVDSELSDTSENPVQNKVITAALGNAGVDYKVTVTATIDEQTHQATIAVDKSVKEIYEAYISNKHCWANIVINGIVTGYQRMELTEAGAAPGTYGVTFGGVQYDDGEAKPVALRGENTNYGEKESDIWITD